MISKRHLHLHRYIESIYFAYCFGSSLNSGSAVQFVCWLLGHCSASRFTPGASDSVLMLSWRRCSWKMVETALAGTNGRIKTFASACVWALFGYGLSSWHHVKSDCCDLLCIYIYTLNKMFFRSVFACFFFSTTAHWFYTVGFKVYSDWSHLRNWWRFQPAYSWLLWLRFLLSPRIHSCHGVRGSHPLHSLGRQPSCHRCTNPCSLSPAGFGHTSRQGRQRRRVSEGQLVFLKFLVADELFVDFGQVEVFRRFAMLSGRGSLWDSIRSQETTQAARPR